MNKTSPKPFVFVLMPFKKEFDDVYKLGIKSACEEAGAYCERVDEQYYDGTILGRIYHQIAVADLIVADMTGRNPNVFYETGYAHALNKRVILLTQKNEDIPFDLKNYPHIVYGGSISDLKDELKKRVKWILSNPQQNVENYFDFPIECFVNDVKLIDCPNIEIEDESCSNVRLLLEIHNSAEQIIKRSSFELGVVTPPGFRYSRSVPEQACFHQKDKDLLFIFDHKFVLAPGIWDRTLMIFTTAKKENSKNKLMKFAIRLFTESSPRDFPFTVKFK